MTTRMTLILCGALGMACHADSNSWTGPDFPGQGNAWYLELPDGEHTPVLSAWDVPAQGMVIAENQAIVGMQDMTCGVHIPSSSVFFDVDDGNGAVTGGATIPNPTTGEPELTALIVDGPLLRLLGIDSPNRSTELLFRNVQDAVLTASGDVVLVRESASGTCDVVWVRPGETAMVHTLPPEAVCAGASLTATSDGQTAWVAAGTLHTVSQDGVTREDRPASNVLWDENTDTLWVMGPDTQQLTRLTTDSARDITLDHPVIDMVVAPDGGLALAADTLGGDRLIRLSSELEVRDQVDLGYPIESIASSPDGRTLGVSMPGIHAYYRQD